jgi:hypothetical protein
MKTRMLLVLAMAVLVSCAGWNKVNNPVSEDYPCGTKAHACSFSPLACCWNDSACGGKGTSCPEGMCCFVGDSYYGAGDGYKSVTEQWSPEK